MSKTQKKMRRLFPEAYARLEALRKATKKAIEIWPGDSTIAIPAADVLEMFRVVFLKQMMERRLNMLLDLSKSEGELHRTLHAGVSKKLADKIRPEQDQAWVFAQVMVVHSIISALENKHFVRTAVRQLSKMERNSDLRRGEKCVSLRPDRAAAGPSGAKAARGRSIGQEAKSEEQRGKREEQRGKGKEGRGKSQERGKR
jgi:hypothetical protein